MGEAIVAIISGVFMVIVAIISLIGVIIQAKSHTKLQTQEDLLSKVNKELKNMQQKSDERDEELNKRIDEIILESYKRFLVTEMTKLIDGVYKPNEAEKNIIHETKKLYNDLGGDSYVDTMFDRLVEQHIL